MGHASTSPSSQEGALAVPGLSQGSAGEGTAPPPSDRRNQLCQAVQTGGPADPARRCCPLVPKGSSAGSQGGKVALTPIPSFGPPGGRSAPADSLLHPHGGGEEEREKGIQSRMFHLKGCPVFRTG